MFHIKQESTVKDSVDRFAELIDQLALLPTIPTMACSTIPLALLMVYARIFMLLLLLNAHKTWIRTLAQL